jgi:hypothetical protein
MIRVIKRMNAGVSPEIAQDIDHKQ